MNVIRRSSLADCFVVIVAMLMTPLFARAQSIDKEVSKITAALASEVNTIINPNPRNPNQQTFNVERTKQLLRAVNALRTNPSFDLDSTGYGSNQTTEKRANSLANSSRIVRFDPVATKLLGAVANRTVDLIDKSRHFYNSIEKKDLDKNSDAGIFALAVATNWRVDELNYLLGTIPDVGVAVIDVKTPKNVEFTKFIVASEAAIRARFKQLNLTPPVVAPSSNTGGTQALVAKLNTVADQFKKNTGPFDPGVLDACAYADMGPKWIGGAYESLSPGIVAIPNEKAGTIDVAWANINRAKTGAVKITEKDRNGNRICFKEKDAWVWACDSVYVHRIGSSGSAALIKKIDVPSGTGSLGGFTKDDLGNYYVLVAAAQYWNGKIDNKTCSEMMAKNNLSLVTFDKDGKKLETFKFDTKDRVPLGREEAGKYLADKPRLPYGLLNQGTGRLAFAKRGTEKRIVGTFTQRAYDKDDEIMHQENAFFALKPDGTAVHKVTGLFGHSFDQRVAWDGDSLVLLNTCEHTTGTLMVKRATFDQPSPNAKLPEQLLHQGHLGGQDRFMHLGGLVVAAKGTCVVSYAMPASRGNRELPYDVYCQKFSAAVPQRPQKLTALTSGTTAMSPKLARLKSGGFVALWEEWKGSGGRWKYGSTMALKLKTNLEPIGKAANLGQMRLIRQDDVFTTANGVGWITGDWLTGNLLVNELNTATMKATQKAVAVPKT